MTNSAWNLEQLAEIGMTSAPVAIAFMAKPPAGLSRIDRSAPASCTYWKQASEGGSFYTTADDHMNCPVGAFTHGVNLPAEKAQELQSLVGTMIELKYLKSEEIPMIPHRADAMQVAAYAPLATAPFPADVVVFRGNARQIMLLWEAAHAAGAFTDGAVMGRPACSMLPQSIATAGGVASVGCIGNRVYTGIGDDDLYLTVPGPQVGKTLEQLGTITRANRELEKFHRDRKARLEQ